MEKEEIDRCLDINLKGVLYGAQAAHPHLMKTAPGSALINTASAAGIMGGAGMSVYCATKFGSEEHTSELQSLMRISYAVFCLKKKTPQPYKKIIEYACI